MSEVASLAPTYNYYTPFALLGLGRVFLLYTFRLSKAIVNASQPKT